MDASIASALEVAKTLGGVLVGALLAGLASLLKARKERKQAIAVALSDLLEVRHRVMALERVLKVLKDKFPGLQSAHMNELRTFFHGILPPDPHLERRYEDAVGRLATIDPVLAYRLRSQPAFHRLFATLHSTARQHPAADENVDVAFQLLHGALSSKLDKAVRELAAEHSWSTRLKVRKIVEEKAELPKELDEIVERAQAAMAVVPNASSSTG